MKLSSANNAATKCVTKTLSPKKKKDENYLSEAELARERQEKREGQKKREEQASQLDFPDFTRRLPALQKEEFIAAPDKLV